jgi:uncharacterized protein (TIGR00255 family)
MLRSMTGFGAGTAEGPGFTVRVEARSVNHRFLQTKVRLPAELSALEPEVEAQLKARLARGAVSLTATIDLDGGAAAGTLDRTLARGYRDAWVELGRELGLSDAPTLAQLTALPGVVRSGPGAPDPDLSAPPLRAAVALALDGLAAMREREGQALAADLEQHARALGELCARLASRSPEAVARQQAALRARLAALLGPERPVEDKDLARELALLADRSDVAEELARLQSHREQLLGLLHSSEPVGRQLDFLVQECQREVNTVGSKGNDAEIARLVIECKTLVERLREQVQNVE